MTRQQWVVKPYETQDGQCPVDDFLNNLPPDEYERMRRQIRRLEEWGPELSRPDAGYLRDKIHELRGKWRRLQLRILYFRDGNKFILSHGIRGKSKRIRDSEIEKAVSHREDYFARLGEEL
jgi:hypothetical protein